MNKSGISRRQFLQWGAMTAGAVALAACAPSAAPSAAPAASDGAAPAAAPTVIQYWTGWGNLDPAIQKIIETDEFKQHMGGATLEYKGSSGQEPVLTAIAAGTPPDAASNVSYVNLFVRGATIDVKDMADASTVLKADDILDGIWNSAFYKGSMIGVPGIECFNWWGLNVNANAAEQVGLDATTMPKTWDEVLEWHKALTKKDDAGNLLQFGLDPFDAMAGEPDFIAASFGVKWFDEETGAFDLGNPRIAEGMDTMGEFIRIAGPDQFAGMRQVEGNGNWGAAFNAGVQNMIIEGYWHPGETQIQKPEVAQFNRSGWAPVPADRKDANIMATGLHAVVIFKDAKNKDGAFKLGEFFQTPTALDIIFNEVGWIHGVKSWLATIDKNKFPGLAFYVDAGPQVTEWTIGRRCPINDFVITQYQELREQVYRNLIDPQAAADELQKRAVAEWQAQGLG
ncbi:MAG: sugar ABC transporter substrate-binding protein [Chloroflexota bacterium]|nr:extracellular solute-binding protein [Caldilinea sp.]GIK75944.1 MAG: sugar ABC transporter substrate-binding protein [Chloroflexota bacterium]